MATRTRANGATNGIRDVVAPQKSTVVEVPALEIAKCKIEVVGTSELLVHNWSKKSRQQMADKQAGKATKKKENRDPVADYYESMYIISGDPTKDQKDVKKPVSSKRAKAVHGIPSTGFKKAMIRGAKMAGAVMTDTRNAFYVEGTKGVDYSWLVPIEFSGVSMHEGIVRLQGKTADLRYRPIYTDWKCDLTIQFNTALIGLDQLINLLRNAGFGVGVCEHRMECDGNFGSFTTGNAEMLGVEAR